MDEQIGSWPTAHTSYVPRWPLDSAKNDVPRQVRLSTVAPAADVPGLPLIVANGAPPPLAARSRPAPARRSATPATSRAEPVAAVEGTSSPPTAGDQNDATRDLALYRAAHRLHFRDRDPGRALPAWEAYLTAFPNGKLAVEAAWNRALCLIKLGRAEDAERLLERFAAGTFGGYRRTQAADLLASLRKHHADP